jgi:tRNA/rRNA methyltransferase
VNFQRAAGSVEEPGPPSGADSAAPSPQDPAALKALLGRVRWVLVRPSHPGNLGSGARALKATGYQQIWLADLSSQQAAAMAADPQAVALAAGADDLLQGCRAESLSEALGPTVIQLALTARPREFEPPRRTIEDALSELVNCLGADPAAEVAIVMGPERSGLSNDDLMHCNRVCGLDVNPAFSSLNLAQATQLVAYLLRQTARRQLLLPTPLFKTDGQGRPRAIPASAAGIEALHQAFTAAAVQTGYLDPENPGRFDERLRGLWSRAGMHQDELQMLHGLISAIRQRL